MEVHIYIHMVDILLGFVCSEVIAQTSNEVTNILEENPTKEREEYHHLMLEGEPIKESKDDPQLANQVITRNISRARE